MDSLVVAARLPARLVVPRLQEHLPEAPSDVTHDEVQFCSLSAFPSAPHIGENLRLP